MGQLDAFWSTIMLKYLVFFLLAKVGVEGSNPFARSSLLVVERSLLQNQVSEKPCVCWFSAP